MYSSIPQQRQSENIPPSPIQNLPSTPTKMAVPIKQRVSQLNPEAAETTRNFTQTQLSQIQASRQMTLSRQMEQLTLEQQQQQLKRLQAEQQQQASQPATKAAIGTAGTLQVAASHAAQQHVPQQVTIKKSVKRPITEAEMGELVKRQHLLRKQILLNTAQILAQVQLQQVQPQQVSIFGELVNTVSTPLSGASSLAIPDLAVAMSGININGSLPQEQLTLEQQQPQLKKKQTAQQQQASQPATKADIGTAGTLQVAASHAVQQPVTRRVTLKKCAKQAITEAQMAILLTRQLLLRRQSRLNTSQMLEQAQLQQVSILGGRATMVKTVSAPLSGASSLAISDLAVAMGGVNINGSLPQKQQNLKQQQQQLKIRQVVLKQRLKRLQQQQASTNVAIDTAETLTTASSPAAQQRIPQQITMKRSVQRLMIETEMAELVKRQQLQQRQVRKQQILKLEQEELKRLQIVQQQQQVKSICLPKESELAKKLDVDNQQFHKVLYE